MTSPNVNASVCHNIQDEIASLKIEQAAVQTALKELLLRENPERGIFFHDQIFRLQQDKLRLETEIQLRQVRLRRAEMDAGDSPRTSCPIF